ncbi:MAG: molybdopterin-dependent oxidoreductase [Gemmatimonadetes bacterium]|nr:molybdopterin-dependent oxidoreductase [Gemmatimonadota bacterium]
MSQEAVLNVNGRTHHLNIDPDTPLIYALRNDLGLMAAKFACGLEQCGACKVIIDGQAVPSCRLSVRSVQGREITTVEGLGTRGNLHPLQQAFIEEQAVQCGFCVPGMIISAKVLLDRNPHPTDEEIKAEMSDNLCRCGVYDRMRRAIKRAAEISEDPSSWKKEFQRKPDTPVAGSAEENRTDPLSGALAFTPDLDSWIRINRDETITVFTGKVELGQHIKTSLAMIAAEELEVNIDRILVVSGDTAQTPNEGYTAGSMSMETSGNAIRHASAEVKQILLSRAAEALNTPMANLTLEDGTITDAVTERSITYWELFGGKSFDVDVMEEGYLKSPDDYQIVGKPLYRSDLVAKVVGEPCFIHDLNLEGMVHGRVVRPPNYQSKLVAIDEEALREIQGVIKLVRDGNFLAVIAEREEQAVQAMRKLQQTAEWESDSDLPSQGSLFDSMRSQPHDAYLIVDGRTVEDPPPEIDLPANAAKTVKASYYRPYHMHASLGPSAAVAQFMNGKLTVWSHNQGPFPLRSAVAHVLGMESDDVRVIHMDGPGCYGHNGADDAALDAALLARANPGYPVSVKWMRDDENAWEPYGPAMIMDAQASLNEEGDIVDWNYDIWSSRASGRPRSDREGGSGLLASWHLEKPFKPLSSPPQKAPGLGSSRNADPLYNLPRKRIVNHLLSGSPLRTSSQRGLGAYANIFAIESFMDELARVADTDPVEFHLRHLTDERARAVIEKAAQMADWGAARGTDLDRGTGLGFLRYKNNASYVATIVELRVNRSAGKIFLEKGIIACDAGQIVNPDGVANQLEGALLQAASWTLREQVNYDEQGITSLDWRSYPILRFRDAPAIDIELINRSDQPYMGVGEGAMGPVSAAIANAVYDAVGVRLRHIPFTPDKVKEALLKQSNRC